MKILKKVLWSILVLLLILMIVFALGPKVNFEPFDNTRLEGTFTIKEVSERVDQRNNNEDIKVNNEEEIVWADGKRKTEYSFVYLHGFSASHEEGAPIHRNVANRFGANLFLSRLPGHGLTGDDLFLDLTPAALVDYAKEAIKIGKSIGDKVIVISCSTGSTLSAYLAAADPDIYAQIMFSPNFEMNNQTTKVLTYPWGLQIARKIKGSSFHEWNTPAVARPFWYHKYRLEGVAALQSLIDQTMKPEILNEIEQPIFVGYYYMDEYNHDFTVSVDKIVEAENLIATPANMKTFIAYPDGKAHVFISPFFNENWEKVQNDVYDFLEKKLSLSPALMVAQ